MVYISIELVSRSNKLLTKNYASKFKNKYQANGKCIYHLYRHIHVYMILS